MIIITAKDNDLRIFTSEASLPTHRFFQTVQKSRCLVLIFTLPEEKKKKNPTQKKPPYISFPCCCFAIQGGLTLSVFLGTPGCCGTHLKGYL